MRRILLPFLAVALLSCSQKKPGPAHLKVPSQRMPVQESFSAELHFSDSGIAKAVLHAKHIRVYADTKETLLDTIAVDFFDKTGALSSTLTALKGRVDDQSKDMKVTGSVVATSVSGVVLKTEELLWKNKGKKLMTDKYVTIDGKSEKIQGYGFESDESFKNYKIYRITYVTSIMTGGGK